MACKGITKDGKRCKRPAMVGSEFCSLHKSQSSGTKPSSGGRGKTKKKISAVQQQYYACVSVPIGQPPPKILSIGTVPQTCTPKKTDTVYQVGFPMITPKKLSPPKKSPKKVKAKKPVAKSKVRKAPAKTKKPIAKKSPEKKAWVPSSYELQDMRKDWLSGKVTNKEIEKVVSDMWSEAYHNKRGPKPTHEGKGLHEIVMKHMDFLEREMKYDPDMEEEYPQSVDFGMLYNLDTDEMDYYPIYGPNESRFEKDRELKNMVEIYSK